MPPWPPETGYGEFADERRLSVDELGLLQQWIEEGAREGNPSDLPAIPLSTSSPHQPRRWHRTRLSRSDCRGKSGPSASPKINFGFEIVSDLAAATPRLEFGHFRPRSRTLVAAFVRHGIPSGFFYWKCPDSSRGFAALCSITDLQSANRRTRIHSRATAPVRIAPKE